MRSYLNPFIEAIGMSKKVEEFYEKHYKNLKLLLQDELEFNDEQFSPSITQAEFSSGFYQGLLLVVLFSFLLMALSVTIAFRTFIPSIAVISAALIDILFPLALLSLFGVKITGAGIVAFLLIIGYSIDTDVLLTTWMIKRKDGSYLERMVKSIKTGVTMTMTTIIVMIIGIVLSISPVLHQMFLIILIALITDLISTYLWNAPILIGYCKRKGI